MASTMPLEIAAALADDGRRFTVSTPAGEDSL
jgi:hypothetical protein